MLTLKYVLSCYGYIDSTANTVCFTLKIGHAVRHINYTSVVRSSHTCIMPRYTYSQSIKEIAFIPEKWEKDS